MRRDEEGIGLSLLRILADAEGPMGASRLAAELALMGIELQPRMVRYHLGRLDRQGWTANLGRAGRKLTGPGFTYLNQRWAAERIELSSARMDELAFRMQLDLLKKRGRLIINLTRISVDALPAALDLMKEVLLSRLGIPPRVAVGLEGETLCGREVPYGTILIGTVCNVTFGGVLRAEGVPVTPRFAGLLEIRDGEPLRFSHMIHYDGSTLDPVHIFTKGRMTQVLPAIRSGNGCIVAGFREIPGVALPAARRVSSLMERMGLGHILALGKPGRPLFGIPVRPGCSGVVVSAGLNLAAALEEAGIETQSEAMSHLYPSEDLLRPAELERRTATSRRARQRIAALMENPPAGAREYTHSE